LIKEEEIEEPATKRPRLMSGDIRKRKQITQSYESMQLLDTLTVVSSITDYAQILPVAGILEQTNVQYSRDFLVSSGNYLKSYLTVATSSVPLDMQPLPLKSVKFQENEKLKVERVFTTNNLVFVSYRLLGVTN
jgi:hypothetical protein